MGERRDVSQADNRARESGAVAEALTSEVRFPWFGLALLAFLIAGFAIMEVRASQERSALHDLTEEIRAQQTAGEARLRNALEGVRAIVTAERTVFRDIVRSEVQAGPTTTVTVTKTTRATVTETQTIDPPIFGPSGCIPIGGLEVCRRDAGMAGLVVGFPFAAYWIVKRSLLR